MKPKFKVGDRVVVVTDGKSWLPDVITMVGMEGRVMEISTFPHVEFDTLTTGHSGANEGSDATNCWAVNQQQLKLASKSSPKKSLADDLSFKPSTRRILAHLRSRGSVTVMEALTAYGTARIAPAIHDLREAGYEIATVAKKDAGGHKYTRYVLEAA